MRSTTSQTGIHRLNTGNRCEEQGCYEMAIWLVTFNGTISHWCAKHTRLFMRDKKVWRKRGVPDIEK